MDIESLQAARLGFNAYVEQRSRVAETAPFLLMQSEVELVQLRAEEINQRGNHDLLTDFTQALPTATTGTFLADSVREARQIQASVLWVQWSDPQGRPSTYHPFYIVGKCPVTEKGLTSKRFSVTHLLLSSARPGGALRDKPAKNLASLIVRDDELAAAQQLTQARKEHGLGDRVKTMFDRDTQKLRVSRADEDSIHTLPVDGSFQTDKKPSRADLVKRVTRGGLSAYSFRTFDNAISDEDMVRFGVFVQLNQLAVDFGQENHYKHLLDGHLKKAEELAAIREVGL